MKVHYKFNIVLHVDQGSPFTALVERISQKLKLPVEDVNLRYYITLRYYVRMTVSTALERQFENVFKGSIW